MSEEYLNDVRGWESRNPTMQECELVGRHPLQAGNRLNAEGDHVEGDYVIETTPSAAGQMHLAKAFEAFGICARAHVIPAGVYVELEPEHAGEPHTYVVEIAAPDLPRGRLVSLLELTFAEVNEVVSFAVEPADEGDEEVPAP